MLSICLYFRCIFVRREPEIDSNHQVLSGSISTLFQKYKHKICLAPEKFSFTLGYVLNSESGCSLIPSIIVLPCRELPPSNISQSGFSQYMKKCSLKC